MWELGCVAASSTRRRTRNPLTLHRFGVLFADMSDAARKQLSPAAERALAEAAARRAAVARQAAERPKETNGPNGPEPTRYGDWERNGIASDF